MYTRIAFISKCLHLAILSTLATSKIIPNHYPSLSSMKNDETNLLAFAQVPQSDEEQKWDFPPVNTKHTNDLEKLKQSLENIFKNEELANYDTNTFGLKTPTLEAPGAPDFSGNEQIHSEGELNSPYIIRVPVPQPYPVHIPVKQPFTVPIYRLVPKEVERKVPIPVEKLVPVYKEKPVKVIVERHHPVHVYKPYAVPIPVHTHVLIGKKKQPKWD